MSIRIASDTEDGILNRRQFVEADELTIERATRLEIRHRHPKLDRVVHLLRRAGNDDELDPLIGGIEHHGHALAAAALTERGCRITVLNETCGDRGLVRIEECEDA